MSATISVTETAALTALRGFLLSIIPGCTTTPVTCEVIRGQINRVPEPTSSDFIVMTPLMQTRLATNIDAFQDNVSTGFRNSESQVQFTIQLDFHGPNSGDNCQIFATLWRDEYATTFFESLTPSIDAEPLFCSDPRQTPFINGENQYEYRWTADAEMQINPVITVDQQFAAQLQATIISVDVAYPP